MRHKYELWQRYGKIHKVTDLIFELTDEEVKILMDNLVDPLEFRRQDGTDISYIFEE